MQIFVKKFYGFSPERAPVITFSQAGSRDSLLKRAEPGDRLVYVATNTEDVKDEALRGRMMGMVTIGVEKVRSLDMLPADASPDMLTWFEQWPEGIPMLEAWRFDPMPPRLEVFDKKTIDSQATRKGAVLLTEAEAQRVLSFPHRPVELPSTDTLAKARIYSATRKRDMREVALTRMVETIFNTVSRSNGQVEERVVKNKTTDLNKEEMRAFLEEALDQENPRCAITGQRLLLSKADGSHWLAPSVDRKDSNGHYTRDNMQIVSKAANFAKNDIAPREVSGFFQALQYLEDDDD